MADLSHDSDSKDALNSGSASNSDGSAVTSRTLDNSHEPRRLSETVYSPESPIGEPLKLIGQICADILRYRELIWTLFLRDLKVQFRQSILGYAWLALPPLASAFVWYMINQQNIINVDTGEMPYAAYALVGTAMWSAFTATISAPIQALELNKDVIMKLNVPMEVFILASFGRVLFSFLISLAVVFPLLILLRLSWDLTAFLFPLYVLCFLLIALSVGLLLTPIGMLYKDIKSLLPPVLSLLMLLSPVIYSMPENEGMLKLILELNPLSPSLVASREVLIGESALSVKALLFAGVALLWAGISLVILRVARPHLIVRLGM